MHILNAQSQDLFFVFLKNIKYRSVNSLWPYAFYFEISPPYIKCYSNTVSYNWQSPLKFIVLTYNVNPLNFFLVRYKNMKCNINILCIVIQLV